MEEKITNNQLALERSQRELADTKQALTRASEKAVKEGVDKTSTETLIKSLQREIEELKNEKSEADKKVETFDKKLQAMANLHKGIREPTPSPSPRERKDRKRNCRHAEEVS